MNKHLLLLVYLWIGISTQFCAAQVSNPQDSFEGYEVTDQGAWCWFADPRALHHESKDGSINKTYMGYIDVHGNIKAMQIDWKTNQKEEVLIRSWFQPDDHNNPTFLVLPDERVMVFYSRHTDEPCFYYRVSRKPGDLTTLGEEKIIKTRNNTTYPSPFILSDDPRHIYLCWRGINWHPTIGRLLMPDAEGNTNFDWGPYQMVQSTGARPYAKYTSNGKDKIYMTYTTGHPDNEYPNDVYFNEIDIHTLSLKDIQGKTLTTIQDGPHQVNKRPEYRASYPDAVVDHSDARHWIWEVAIDAEEKPVIAMVKISEDKKSHDYYYVNRDGDEWKKTFLSHAGGHFHQTPVTELCYSGGMSINKKNIRQIYGSVPVKGEHGTVYEILKFTIDENGKVEKERITRNSLKNNSRPYFIPHTKDEDQSLIWMHGDYYDWIVSAKRPLGYNTAIRSIFPLPTQQVSPATPTDTPSNDFTIFMVMNSPTASYPGVRWDFGDFGYGIDKRTIKPYLFADHSLHLSNNVWGNSDAWKQYQRTTNGKWLAPVIPQQVVLCITYTGNTLRTYINGLLDQSIDIEGIQVSEPQCMDSKDITTQYRFFNRALGPDEIKQRVQEVKVP